MGATTRNGRLTPTLVVARLSRSSARGGLDDKHWIPMTLCP
jgi:hypothetical protein